MTASAFLLDASIPIFRYYFSLPERWFSVKEGYGTAAAYGYSHWLRRFLADQQPRFVAACFDESLGTCFRHEIDPLYKSRRQLADDMLQFQLSACKQITELMGVSVYASSRYEADDLIGTLASRNRAAGRLNVIISRDKDLGQLLDGGDCLWHYPDQPALTAEGIQDKFGVAPRQIPDWLALVGDPADDIPGVPGIGPKTASELLRQFDSVVDVFARLDELAQLPIRGAALLAVKLAPFEEQVMRSLRLTTIVCDAPLGRRFQMKKQPVQWRELQALTQQLGFSFKRDPRIA